jgi:hypothetical protein
MMASRVLRFVLISLTAFLALTAFAGGIGLLADLNTPSLEMLEGSPFHNYAIPGLALFVLVGGSAMAGAYLLAKRHRFAATASLLAGLVIMAFEIVEVLAIGFEPGVSRNLQIFYFTLGLLIAALSIAFRVVNPASTQRPQSFPT